MKDKQKQKGYVGNGSSSKAVHRLLGPMPMW